MNELIKERNELARQLYVNGTDTSAEQAVNWANDLMHTMYGQGWDKDEEPVPEVAESASAEKPYINNPAVISIVDYNGEKWVRVRAMGDDFIIAPHDLDGGADHFSFDSAQEKLKELGLDTFNRNRGLIIAICIEDINKALVDAGGDKFAKDIYISSELFRRVGSADYAGDASWYFNGDSGFVSRNFRCYGCFRCRPVLAYNA